MAKSNACSTASILAKKGMLDAFLVALFVEMLFPSFVQEVNIETAIKITATIEFVFVFISVFFIFLHNKVFC